jgi:hypothetical protein
MLHLKQGWIRWKICSEYGAASSSKQAEKAKASFWQEFVVSFVQRLCDISKYSTAVCFEDMHARLEERGGQCLALHQWSA